MSVFEEFGQRMGDAAQAAFNAAEERVSELGQRAKAILDNAKAQGRKYPTKEEEEAVRRMDRQIVRIHRLEQRFKGKLEKFMGALERNPSENYVRLLGRGIRAVPGHRQLMEAISEEV